MSETLSQRSFLSKLFVSEPLGAAGWQDVGLLVLRVFAGVTMAGGGMDKIPVGSWFEGQVADIGFPLPRLFAFAAALSEFAGGWLLVLGLLSRPAAFFMAVTMGVASWTIHAEVAFWGLHIARIYFWVYVCLTFTGGGKLSMDHLFRLGRVPIVVFATPVLILACICGYQELFVAPQIKNNASVSFDEAQSVSLAGSFNNWTLDATPMSQGDDGIWCSTVTITESGPIEFKFAADNDWTLNAGALADAKSGFPLAGRALTNTQGEPQNIKAYIPSVGEYEFSLNASELSYTLNVEADNAGATSQDVEDE